MTEDDEDAIESRADAVGDRGAGGARVGEDTTDADRAVTGETPVEAAVDAEGITAPIKVWYAELTAEERSITGLVLGFFGVLGLLVVVGVLNSAYLLNVLGLAGMYVLLSLGLNVQWGYTGLINFSVAAFFGIGAYSAALLASTDSPLTGGAIPVLNLPIVGIFAAMLVTALLAVLIGIPTLSLREDYLAIASLGLAEVVHSIVRNQQSWTDGTRGLLGMPRFLVSWPYVGEAIAEIPGPVFDFFTVVVFAFVAWLFLRRIHRSPWGRVQRLIRSDEDLAEALGKNTFRLRMESFVIGSVVMALAGVFFVHLNDSLFPSSMGPIRTFYVWIAVILGGSGSDRGAIIGGIAIVTILEGTRFFAGNVPFIDGGSLRLLMVGFLIILVMRFRPDGVLPPQRELIWPPAQRGDHHE